MRAQRFAAMPFRIGLQDFHLEATVTAVGINTGGGVGAEVPLDVFTLYALSWAGGSTDSDTLNGTVRAAEGKDVMTPRLCASVPVGLFSAEVTNDYDQTSGNNGDCAPALGQECVDTITNADFSTDDTEGCAPFTVPEACMESMPANGTIAMGCKPIRISHSQHTKDTQTNH